MARTRPNMLDDTNGQRVAQEAIVEQLRAIVEQLGVTNAQIRLLLVEIGAIARSLLAIQTALTPSPEPAVTGIEIVPGTPTTH